MKTLYEAVAEKENDTEPPPREVINIFPFKQIDFNKTFIQNVLLPFPKTTPTTFEVMYTTTISTCQKLWTMWSQPQTLFDTWEFRYAFWLGYNHVPYFLSLKKDNKPLGLLPLWYDNDEKQFKWFGSDWHEDNKFFITNSEYLPLLLKFAPDNTYLNALDSSQRTIAENYQYFTPDEAKYTLSLKSFTCLDDFLETLNKKKRYNFHRDQKHITSLQPQIIFNNFEHLSELIRLNKERFEKRGIDSGWEDQRKVKTFTEIITQGLTSKVYEPRMISVVIDGKIAAVDLIILYKDTYYGLKSGNDVEHFPGIGNYLNLLEIEDAINLKKQKIDFP